MSKLIQKLKGGARTGSRLPSIDISPQHLNHRYYYRFFAVGRREVGVEFLERPSWLRLTGWDGV